jgi:hypothetical protein
LVERTVAARVDSKVVLKVFVQVAWLGVETVGALVVLSVYVTVAMTVAY